MYSAWGESGILHQHNPSKTAYFIVEADSKFLDLEHREEILFWVCFSGLSEMWRKYL